MIQPYRDSLIASLLTLVGLAALAWGLPRLWEYGENDLLGGIATVIGGLTAFFGFILFLNFRWAFRIARRMRRGEDIIGRWTIPTEMVDAYLASEETQPLLNRSRWKPKPGKPLDILFSPDAVLAGDSLHGLSSKGLQTYTAVDLIYGKPLMIQFHTREVAVVGDRIASHHAVLRLPVARGADEPAGKVMAHFRQSLSDAKASNPNFWRNRLRIGLGVAAACAIMAGYGWYLAQQSGWSGNDTQGLSAMVMMIAGAIFGLAALALATIATARMRR